jgi:2-polyprenyl-3-methyl-5-hydroxy-6-metoxy-1,4-benzoquinol methylase
VSADEAPADPLRDAGAFWKAVSTRRADVARALYARYPLVPRTYVARHFLRFSRLNQEDPRAILYLDAELGAPARGVALLEALESAGLSVAGARCLDIGCANGGLLLAAAAKGASRLVGVEISPLRLGSARRLTRGRGVELVPLDAAREELPAGHGPFDVIFCFDVLEHVSSPSATLAFIKRHLAAGPRSFSFLSLFNPRHPDNVAAEPHYGVPGMILLPRGEAADLWLEVRKAYGSALDYEVADWTPYGALLETLARTGLTSSPFVDSGPVLDRRRPFWAGWRERIADLEARVDAGVRGLAARPALKQRLLEQLRRYCDRYVRDHEAISSGARDDQLLAFYVDYYSHTIQLVLRHAAPR